MGTYRYGEYETWDGIKFYQIEKKTWWGWKEFEWWKFKPSGKEKMMDVVKQLKEQGNILIP